MRAVVMHETGGPEVLVLTDIPKPEPGPGQVLVRIEAIGVSVGETRMRAGAYPLQLPMVLGAEAAGVVEKLGDGVEPSLMDARVVMVTGGAGSYAEFIAVNAGNVTKVPDGLSAQDAVASAAPGALALALLHRAGLRGGETVLVEGGSGKVGGYLVRHVREFGVERIVATASRKPVEGADVVLDHGNPDWTDDLDPLDVAFDMAGGETTRRVLGKLKPGGRMLLYGALTAQPELDPVAVQGQGLQVIGCGGPLWFRQCLDVHYPEFVDLAARGRTHLQPVADVLPLDLAAEAHRRVAASAGRILLRPNLGLDS
ncbi:quinone oxidoreductase family protein [Actinocrispum wychmicini]|uniref:NADPH:quinone reductase-like Zn-dependent oxidoreductase n=1 Tax=Actinocrispum wychmicini TaxID=1213861 RepID=A0A4R2K6M5_9PSEU|nr:zinc-binding dehydrogenase [Actinocrispum wychmicini]TCO65478.1 NADPH:quinone reductase-like Zn-dependent oxidoreductase [Actinocrispum wychmicini]